MKKKALVVAIALSLLLSGMVVAVGGEVRDEVENEGEKVDESVSGESDAHIEGEEKLTFASGNGTKDDPYMIENVTQLQNMNNNLTAHYELANDIDASETKNWNNGSGFKPVGDEDIPFTGSLDGRNHTITDLYINRSTDSIGLFNYVGEEGEIRNVGIVDGSIIERGFWFSNTVAPLIGYNEGTVMNSYATGTISVDSGYVGGLVAKNTGTISNSYVADQLTCDGVGVGGLVAKNTGTISDSYATEQVTCDGGFVGGLVGRNTGSISNSYATHHVTSDGEYVGGLVGSNSVSLSGEATIDNSYATGNVNGNEKVGGLIGENGGSRVSNSYATGDVNGSDYVGGLVGENSETIENSYATGNVTGSDYVGGLVGENSETIENSYSTGNVTGSDVHLGGLIGYNDGRVTNTYSIGKVSGFDYMGGLVGKNDDTVERSFWNTETSGLTWSDGGEEKTTLEMKDVATYTDTDTEGLNKPWDFVANPNDDTGNEELWDIDEDEEINEGYPFLVWEHEVHTLTINIEGDGTVKVDGKEVEDRWTGEFVEGTNVTLEALPVQDENWDFGVWTGDVPEDEEGKQINLTMDSNKTITANFGESVSYPEDGGIPGFTSTLLLLAVVTAVAIYRKKKRKS